jgi:hypothetical protein
MDTDESYYVLIAAALTGNATMAQQAQLEQLLESHDSIQKVYNELSFIYQQPLLVKTEKFDADTAFHKLSAKLLI